MAATYDVTLATDRDWVRFLINDRVTAKAVLQDEEIDALLVEEGNKYLAAARAGELILLKQGFLEELEGGDGDVRLRWSRTKTDEFRAYLATLKAKGLAAVGGQSYFRVL